MVYELIVGLTPFYDGGMTQMDIFNRILQSEYEFPLDGELMSSESKDLITQLLVVNPHDRIGCSAGGHEDIRLHPWFSSIPWDTLEAQTAQVPWTPAVKNPLDAGNFNKWEHLENADEEAEKPLSSKEQSLFDDF